MDFMLLPDDDDEPIDLDGLVHPPSWHGRAACRVADRPDVFFPSHKADKATALDTCARCPVCSECLSQALQTPERDDYGIWGGLTRSQRRALRRERAGEAA